MEIARMEAGQVPAVAALERQCFSEPWSERTLAQELENPRAAFWTASEGGQLAGYAGMHRVLDEGYIANVAVDAAFRRQGVATALLRTLLEDAQIHVCNTGGAGRKPCRDFILSEARVSGGRQAERVLHSAAGGRGADDPVPVGKFGRFRAIGYVLFRKTMVY